MKGILIWSPSRLTLSIISWYLFSNKNMTPSAFFDDTIICRDFFSFSVVADERRISSIFDITQKCL